MSKNYQTIETSLNKEVVGITLPAAFEVYTKQLFGEERYNIFFKGLQQSSSVSIRLNPFKTSETTQIANRFEPIPIAWCKEGFYLNVRPNFTFDPLFHAGAYYVQEASSMFLSHVLRHLVRKPVALLDLCAAPGGKTTCARTAIKEGSIVFSNEPINKRAQILAENVQKFGHSDVVVTNNYPRDYKKSKLEFDVIVADVPCSGEGMFRKDPQAISEWSEQNVTNCWQLQRSIIADIWENLKPGGLLIYSTCTFNAHENEENVAWILNEYDAQLLEVPTEKTWNITGSLINNPLGEDKPFPVYRFIPGFTQGEGLFMAIIKKGGTSINLEPNAEKLVAEANKKLKIMAHGVKQGIIKGKKIIPDHSLALAINGDRSSYPNVEIDYETAIKYLRHEAIMLSAVVPKGIVTLTYRGHAIGFANNLGNRANNLYPQEWRIKSSHIPNEQIILT
ncbi:methyltransferase RsmF C-terminal domain-like protein [Prevotella aurantiaca]|mgnify:FL=1|jgi:NOL1/NOP2/sun family protein|uniref:methyltransferase RsmF C-terminal domain-like protein n=1 Tax=Prevotella aurantiaca TaxID=596085 RepID=UPI0023F03D5C